MGFSTASRLWGLTTRQRMIGLSLKLKIADAWGRLILGIQQRRKARIVRFQLGLVGLCGQTRSGGGLSRGNGRPWDY
jgi:hypothetical protein